MYKGVSRDPLQFEYIYCRDYDKVCPFWVVGHKRAYEWLEAAQHQLHPDVKRVVETQGWKVKYDGASFMVLVNMYHLRFVRLNEAYA